MIDLSSHQYVVSIITSFLDYIECGFENTEALDLIFLEITKLDKDSLIKVIISMTSAFTMFAVVADKVEELKKTMQEAGIAFEVLERVINGA